MKTRFSIQDLQNAGSASRHPATFGWELIDDCLELHARIAELEAEVTRLTTDLALMKIQAESAYVAAQAEMALKLERLTAENAALRDLAKSSGCNLCRHWLNGTDECNECDDFDKWEPPVINTSEVSA